MQLTIRPVSPDDRAGWNALFEGYAEFYRIEQTPQMRDTVWGWLMDVDHTTGGFVAEEPEGHLIGLTHFRPFASPLRAATNCFLDDLFVDPEARGSGAAQALIGAVADHARAQGWATVRWITADDNYRGRGVYDRVATRTMWITYDLTT